VSSDGGATGTAAGSSSPITVTGLTNGRTYTCTVAANNSAGTGSPSGASNAFVAKAAQGLPGAPTIGTVTAGNASASVPFTPPAFDGGSPISSYTATCTSGNGGATGTATRSSSPIAVAALSNGHTYTCTVTATNAFGPGAPSAASNSFVPSTVPGAPKAAIAVPYGDRQAKVIWNPPLNNGGVPVTGYVVKPFLAGVAQPVHVFNVTKTTELIGGLQDTKVYSFEIAAQNANGVGPFSAMSGGMIAGAPGQPGQVTAMRVSAGSLRVSFAAPNPDGSAITSYTATCVATGGATKTQTAKAGPITVTGLTPTKSYTCTVNATNSRGTGPRSKPSTPVAP
jgi:hypothetical protein